MSRPTARRANLEVSLKPFADFGAKTLSSTVARIFDDWSVLLAAAEECSVLLWASDGSEILDWTGDLDQNSSGPGSSGSTTPRPPRTGNGSRPVGGPCHSPSTRLTSPTAISPGSSPRSRPRVVDVASPPRSGPRSIRGRSLRRRSWAPPPSRDRARGEDVGIGPIIAMVRHFSVLSADDHAYAAFPTGIPEGTTFGEFLGARPRTTWPRWDSTIQVAVERVRVQLYAWSELGESFDGERFAAERTPEPASGPSASGPTCLAT